MGLLVNRELETQIRAGIIGHAIGDALGVPVEFTEREQLLHCPVCTMKGFGTHNVPAGTWSDDTSMEIALVQSLIDCGCFNYDDIMKNFCLWWNNNQFTATGKTFDIGITCARAIDNYLAGNPPLQCGGTHPRSNGNGSLMRILPVAFICYQKNITGPERYELVRKVSSLTHAHELSVLGCYIYVNFVCHLLDGDSPSTAYQKTQSDDYSMTSYAARYTYCSILVSSIADRSEEDISSSGYVLSSLEASLWCLLNSSSYEDAVLRAVNLGNDTDTIGAITGSMAGIYYGYGAIPTTWIEGLQCHDYLLTVCHEFASTKIQFS